MQVAAPVALHPRLQDEYAFGLGGKESIVSDNDHDEQNLIVERLRHLGVNDDIPHIQELEEAAEAEAVDMPGDYEESGDDDLEDQADETRLRYARLAARGRAAELAYNLRIERARSGQHQHVVHDAAPSQAHQVNLPAHPKRQDRSRSHSKSRSRPATPILGSLFKRDNFVLGITRSQSPPVSSAVAPDKSSRRSSVSNFFKFKPLSRSSSSKSIHVSGASSTASSSLPTSPFPSPLATLSPLPYFLSPKTRRKPLPTTGEDVEIGMLTIDGTPLPSSFGSPLTRTARRASPTRASTMPLNNDELDYSSSTIHRRPSRGANATRFNHQTSSRRSEHRSLQLAGAGSIPAATPHLVYAAEQTSSFTDDEEDDLKK